jgi:hypothetical protein
MGRVRSTSHNMAILLLCLKQKKTWLWLAIYESVDLIGFSFKVEAYKKFYHRPLIPRIKFIV